MPTRANPGRKSPLELLTKKPVSVADVVVFGSPFMVYQDPKNASLGKRGAPGIIVGKNEETKGYKVLIPGKQVVVTTRHVNQIETLTSEANKQLRQALESEADDELETLADGREVSRRREESNVERPGERAAAKTASTPTTTARAQTRTRAKRDKELKSKSKAKREAKASEQTDAEEEVSNDDYDDTNKLPLTSGRVRTKSAKQQAADDAEKTAQHGPRDPVAAATLFQSFFMSALGAGEEQYTNLPDPKSYKASRVLPDARLWAHAMNYDIASLETNNTWQVVKREKHMHVLRNKWVIKKKMSGSGSIERYKARPVAGGDD